jgi:hypothetical protein
MNRRLSLAVAAAALVVGACSGHAAPRPATAPSVSTAPAGATTTVKAPAQTVVVTPSTHLADRQVVHVVGRGYTPGQPHLAVIECAVLGGRSGQDDCNIAGIVLASVDANGGVDATFPVVKGPFGSNADRCVAPSQCVISVTQLSLTPAEYASAPISFA